MNYPGMIEQSGSAVYCLGNGLPWSSFGKAIFTTLVTITNSIESLSCGSAKLSSKWGRPALLLHTE
jgi:hypothetical protein